VRALSQRSSNGLRLWCMGANAHVPSPRTPSSPAVGISFCFQSVSGMVWSIAIDPSLVFDHQPRCSQVIKAEEGSCNFRGMTAFVWSIHKLGFRALVEFVKYPVGDDEVGVAFERFENFQYHLNVRLIEVNHAHHPIWPCRSGLPWNDPNSPIGPTPKLTDICRTGKMRVCTSVNIFCKEEVFHRL
jgi:hypothetical protein